MVLSSNWLELQKSQNLKSVGNSKKRNDTKNAKHKNSNKVSKMKKVQSQKSSKLMEMVYSMNKEIANAELSKKEGKIFEFKQSSINPDGVVSSDPVLAAYSESYQSKTKDVGKYVALDCEFVGVGPNSKESALARVSIVNYFGHVVLDEFVKPRDRVTDWRTWVSGIRPDDMKNAITFAEAQKKASSILDGKILVGHSVKHDLEALLLSHPKNMTRDTSTHLPFKRAYSKGKTPSLKKLAKELLGKEIQDGQHSSVEDARITMEIYKSEKKEFEKLSQTAKNKLK